MDRLLTRRDLVRHVRKLNYDFEPLARAHFEAAVGPATCAPGCAHCCYAKVVIHVTDGVVMYLFLRQQGLWSSALERKLVEADRQMTAATHAEHLGARRPCAFLREESFGRGTCEVYPVRPLGCAATFSDVPDPAACAVPGGKALAQVVGPSVEQAMGSFHREVAIALQQEEAWCFTLPGAVLYGHALMEGLTPPAVHRISIEQVEASGLHIEDLFDQAAGRPG